MRPSFDDVTVNEGDLLELICVTNDTWPTTSTHIQGPITVPRRLPNNSTIIHFSNTKIIILLLLYAVQLH